jgi:hypothetical protein
MFSVVLSIRVEQTFRKAFFFLFFPYVNVLLSVQERISDNLFQKTNFRQGQISLHPNSYMSFDMSYQKYQVRHIRKIKNQIFIHRELY